MVVDQLERAERYCSLHPGFPPAFAKLRELLAAPDLAVEGRHEWDGDRLFVIIARAVWPRPKPRLEAHCQYIDIQCTLAGTERIGWRPFPLSEPEEPHQPDRDIAFYADAPTSWLEVPTGAFAIFFPEDAHAPLAGEDCPLKAVVKVAVRWC